MFKQSSQFGQLQLERPFGYNFFTPCRSSNCSYFLPLVPCGDGPPEGLSLRPTGIAFITVHVAADSFPPLRFAYFHLVAAAKRARFHRLLLSFAHISFAHALDPNSMCHRPRTLTLSVSPVLWPCGQ